MGGLGNDQELPNLVIIHFIISGASRPGEGGGGGRERERGGGQKDERHRGEVCKYLK